MYFIHNEQQQINLSRWRKTKTTEVKTLKKTIEETKNKTKQSTFGINLL